MYYLCNLKNNKIKSIQGRKSVWWYTKVEIVSLSSECDLRQFSSPPTSRHLFSSSLLPPPSLWQRLSPAAGTSWKHVGEEVEELSDLDLSHGFWKETATVAFFFALDPQGGLG